MKKQLGLTILVMAVAIATVGCSAVVKSDNSAPQISYVSPESVPAGSANFVLDVVGSGFSPNSMVFFNGRAHATQFVSENQLSASIPSTEVTEASAVPVVVQWEPPHGLVPVNSSFNSNSLMFHIRKRSSSLQIMTTSLPDGIVQQEYGADMAVAGGVPPYRWRIPSGQLPPGLTQSSTTGTISGTPNNEGQFQFTVQVTDASSPKRQTDTRTLTVKVTAESHPPLLITTGALPDGTLQVAYAAALAATGGVAPYRWSKVSGSLAPGLTLSTDGPISGMPSSTGTFSFSARVTDSGSPAQSAETSLSITVSESGSSDGVSPADPNASPKTRSVLNYLSSLPSRPDKRVLSGHTFDLDELAQNWEDIGQATGHFPAMMGGRYTGLGKAPGEFNPILIDHWNRGGLVTVDHRPHNPKTGRSADDANFTSADMESCLTPGTPFNQAFMSDLDELAGGLSELQNSGVVSLLRLLPEMNGNWIWYGQGTGEQFRRLWRLMFNYLTVTKNLHSLLFVWSPNAGTGAYADLYPGGSFVDVVALDYYLDVAGITNGVPKAEGYDELTALAPSKPIALGEFGPLAPDETHFSSRDYDQLILGIRQNMPQVVYWVSWINVFTMGRTLDGQRHLNVKKLLDDSWVVNLGDVRLP